jgi:hypothetical protein
LQGFGSRVAKLGAVMAGAFAGVAVATGLAVKGALEQAEELGDTADQLGMPVQQLTALKYAAESSGGSLEALTGGLKTLQQNMAAAAADGFGGMGQAFRSIGVAVKDARGDMRSANDVMLDVADKMEGMREGAGKTALMLQLFGSEGLKLKGMLNEGRDGIADLTAEAAKLGYVLDDKTRASAEAFNANLRQLTTAKEMLTLQITARLAPSLEALSDKFVAFAGDTERVQGVADYLTKGFQHLVTVIARVNATVAAAKLVFTSFWDEAGNQTSMGEYWKRLTEGYEKIVSDYRAGLMDVHREISRLPLFAEMGAKMKESLDKTEAPIQGALNRLREEFNYKFSDPFAGIATKVGLLNDAFKRGVIPMMEYKTMLRQLQFEEMAQLRAAAKATLEDTLASGAVTAAEKMRALEQAVRSGTITFAEFGAKAKEVSKDAMQAIQSSIDSVSNGMADAFRQFTESGKFSFKEMTRSILADLAQLTFKMMVLKPLFGDGGTSAGLFGSLLKGVFAPGGGVPGFADGGRPAVGMPARVGERGKELFVPDTPGTIIPNHMLQDGGGAGGQIVVRVEHSPDFYARVDTRMQNVVTQSAPAIVGASLETTRRNLPGMIEQAQKRRI